jgi:Holliday junction resolvase-like predicted endonuclease
LRRAELYPGIYTTEVLRRSACRYGIIDLITNPKKALSFIE